MPFSLGETAETLKRFNLILNSLPGPLAPTVVPRQLNLRVFKKKKSEELTSRQLLFQSHNDAVLTKGNTITIK